MLLIFLIAITILLSVAGVLVLMCAGGRWRLRGCDRVLVEERRRVRRMLLSHRNPAAWAGLALLLVVLAACGDTPRTAAPPPSPTTRPASITAAPTVGQGADWTTYHRDNSRTGYVANAPDPHQLTQAWNKHLDGAVYAEPLYVKGHVMVATEGDSLYSLDAATGKILWKRNVGTPVARSTLPCGNIDPLGITGTPVYDPKTNLIFAVAEITGPAHILVGVDADSGALRVRHSADPANANPQVYQQRAALALSHDRVYIAYGGLAGDCGPYRGTVIAIPTSGQGPVLTFVVPTPREGGIWAPPGPVVDGDGNLYVSVGNGETTQGAWDHSDSVLRLSPKLKLQDGFAPTGWQQENATDADLGSMSPLPLPGGLLFIAGKGGNAYLLHAGALGGVGDQAQVKSICVSFGGGAIVGSTIFVPCVDGVRQISIGPGATMNVGWHAPTNVNGSPIVGGHTVYVVDLTGALYALDSTSGTVRAHVAIEPTSRFATPTLAGGSIFVGTLTGVVAVTLS